jgi:putative hydrolase of HD superfamily
VTGQRDLDFLYEVGCLRHMDRVWVQFQRPNVANVAEHTMRVAWIAEVLAHREGADVGRVVRMALVHDLGKSRAGDGHWINREYMKRDETKAIAATVRATVMEAATNELWTEFKTARSLEARIVKDADNLDTDIELHERQDEWRFGKEMGSVRRRVFEQKLFTESAKQLWQQVQESDPHRWYASEFNRLGGEEVGAAENH